MTGEVPRRHAFEAGDPHLKHKNSKGELVVDPIRDDQTVVVDTPEGLFVVLGCSHAGIVNILDYIIEKTGKSRFHTVIGGTHLGPAGSEQQDLSLEALLRYDIGRMGVSHCTGQKVAARMMAAFGERFLFSSVGVSVEV